MTDKELVRKLKTDPQTGLAAVIDRYTAYLLKIARIKLDGLCTDEDIEEAVSDVFFIFYKKGQQCGFDIRSVRAYLSLIAERHFTDVFRRQIKRPDDIPIDDLSETLPDRQSGEENTAVAATGTLHKVQQFFHQDISPYEDQIMGTAQMVSNDDITMSIDGVIADEVQCRVVLSLTSKTKEGEKILEQLEYASDEYYTDCRKLNEKAKKKTENGMSEEDAHAWYIEQIKKLPPHSFTLNFKNGDRISDNTNREDMTDEQKANYDPDKYFSFANYVTVRDLKTSDYENDKYHYYEMFTFEMNEIDRTKPFIISESGSGLSVELDINEFFDSHRLVSDDPQAFDYAVISPIAVYVRSTQNDIDSGRRLKDGGERYNNEMTEVTVNFTDGTSRTLNNITICKSTDMNDELKQFDTEQERLDYINAHRNDADVTDQTLEANGDQLFDLEKTASVTIDGITYTIER